MGSTKVWHHQLITAIVMCAGICGSGLCLGGLNLVSGVAERNRKHVCQMYADRSFAKDIEQGFRVTCHFDKKELCLCDIESPKTEIRLDLGLR